MALTEREELELLELENENELALQQQGKKSPNAEPTNEDFASFMKAGIRTTPASPLADVIPGKEGVSPERVQEMGGVGKAAYKLSSVPSRELTKGLKAIVERIPDPETRSAAANFALGIPETLGEIGAEAVGGSVSPEALLLAGLPKGAVSGSLKKASDAAKAFVEKNFPKVSQAMTGVHKKYFARILQKPSTVLPKSLGGPKGLEEAGEAVGAAEEAAFGKFAKPDIREINDPALNVARRNSIKAAETLEQIKELAKTDPQAAAALMREQSTGALMLKGKRGTQMQLDQPSMMGSRKALLSQQRDEMKQALSENFPELGKELQNYSDTITREQVKKILPVLRNGDPSIARGILAFLSPLGSAAVGGVAAGAPGAAVALAPFSPVVHATVTALTKLGLNKLEELAIKSPALRRPVLMAIATLKGRQNAE